MARARKENRAENGSALCAPRLEAAVRQGDRMAFIATLGEKNYTVEIDEVGKSLYRISIDGHEFLVDGKKTGRTNYSLILDNRSFEVEVDSRDDEYRVLVDGRNYHVHLTDERRML